MLIKNFFFLLFSLFSYEVLSSNNTFKLDIGNDNQEQEISTSNIDFFNQNEFFIGARYGDPTPSNQISNDQTLKKLSDELDKENSQRLRFFLSIDGGGIKGIIPALYLEKIESVIKNDFSEEYELTDLFDGFAGTSVGGIMATILNCPRFHINSIRKSNPYKASDLVKLFKEDKNLIFPGENYLESTFYNVRRLFTSKYSPQSLEALLDKSLGNKKLSQAVKPLLVTAVETTPAQNPALFFFDSELAVDNFKEDFYMKDVARATSAAPSYFSTAKIKNCSKPPEEKYFEDGGVKRNDPSYHLYKKVKKKYPGDKIVIISLGTGHSKKTESAFRSWIRSFGGMLCYASHGIEDSMDMDAGITQQDLNDSIDQKDCVIRIQVDLETEIPLDSKKPADLEYLEKLAKENFPFMTKLAKVLGDNFRLLEKNQKKKLGEGRDIRIKIPLFVN